MKLEDLPGEVCPVCGTPTDEPGRRVHRVFCSKSCCNKHHSAIKIAARSAERAAARAAHVCPVCSRRYAARRRDQVYCSRYCQNLAYGRRRFGDSTPPCQLCGKPVPPVAGRRWCSMSCAARAREKAKRTARAAKAKPVSDPPTTI